MSLGEDEANYLIASNAKLFQLGERLFVYVVGRLVRNEDERFEPHLVNVRRCGELHLEPGVADCGMRGDALRHVHCQELPEQVLDAHGQLLRDGKCAARDAAVQVRVRLGTKGKAPAEQRVEENAHGPHVHRLALVLGAAHDLRGHVCVGEKRKR